MTPLAWLVGLALPACAAAGAQGLPQPQAFDMGRIERPSSPNTALAGPAGFAPTPDVETPTFEVPAARLRDAVLAVAATQPRTFLAADHAAQRQIHWVVRSAIFNFPDLVTAQITDAGQDRSTLVLYSRSVYGYSDLGANRQRLNTWLAAVQTKINHPGER
jgi:uncharacterized protein (DUF1499 family)